VKGDFGLNSDSDADRDGDSDGTDVLTWQRQLDSHAAMEATAVVPELANLLLCCSPPREHHSHGDGESPGKFRNSSENETNRQTTVFDTRGSATHPIDGTDSACRELNSAPGMTLGRDS
jgi:hypothetical protein